MFLCFSSGDRNTIVKSCLYHLKNYGIDVWYDYHELILGDHKREKNFEHAIKNNDYFIVIYSDNFFNSPCAIEEEQRIFKELEKRKISVFPLLYNIKFSNLPLSYQEKIDNLIYNEINDNTGSLNSINQIITKVLIDKITKSENDETPILSSKNYTKIKEIYVKELLRFYDNIEKSNFNARIAVLFSISKYLELKYPDEKNEYLYKIVNYLFKFTNLNIEFNHKEIIISELAIMLLLESIF